MGRKYTALPDLTAASEHVQRLLNSEFVITCNGCKILLDETIPTQQDGRPVLGRITIDGKAHMVYAHRLVLELLYGRRMEKGEQANHRCHNPRCVNVLHLYIGTARENYVDMVKAGRAAWQRAA